MKTILFILGSLPLLAQQPAAPAPATPPAPAAAPDLAIAAPQAKAPTQSKPISKALAADAMRRAVEGFVSRLPGRVDDLLSLSAAREMEKLRTLVHQLKGAGAGYGFPAITQTAAKTEATIKRDGELDAVRIAVDELITLIRGTAGYDPAREQQKVVDKNKNPPLTRIN